MSLVQKNNNHTIQKHTIISATTSVACAVKSLIAHRTRMDKGTCVIYMDKPAYC